MQIYVADTDVCKKISAKGSAKLIFAPPFALISVCIFS